MQHRLSVFFLFYLLLRDSSGILGLNLNSTGRDRFQSGSVRCVIGHFLSSFGLSFFAQFSASVVIVDGLLFIGGFSRLDGKVVGGCPKG